MGDRTEVAPQRTIPRRLRELQKIKSPKRSFVVTDQRSSSANVGAQCLRPPEGASIAPLHFFSVKRLDDLYFAIP